MSNSQKLSSFTQNLITDANGNTTGLDLANISVSNANLGYATQVTILGGSSGQVLGTDGTGNLNWVNQPTPSASPAGGANTTVQYNNAGNLAGSGDFLYSAGQVTVPNLQATATANFQSRVNLGSVGNVKITGGSANQFLQTDGTGNLVFANASSSNGSVTQVNTAGSGLGFSLSGGPITSTGTVSLTTPDVAGLRSTLGIGTAANVSLNGNANTFLDGTGNWSSVNTSELLSGLKVNDVSVPPATGNINFQDYTVSNNNRVLFNRVNSNIQASLDTQNPVFLNNEITANGFVIKDVSTGNTVTLTTYDTIQQQVYDFPNAYPNSNVSVLAANLPNSGKSAMTWVELSPSQETITFTVTSNSYGQTFQNAGLRSFADNTFAAVFRNGVKMNSEDYLLASDLLIMNVWLETQDVIEVAPTSGAKTTGGSGGLPGGSNTQIQFNDENNFAGNPFFTFNKLNRRLTVTNLTANSATFQSSSTGLINIVAGSAQDLNIANASIIEAQVNGNLNVEGPFTANSTATIEGNLVANGTATIEGNIVANSNVTVMGNLDIDQNISSNGNLDINGNSVSFRSSSNVFVDIDVDARSMILNGSSDSGSNIYLQSANATFQRPSGNVVGGYTNIRGEVVSMQLANGAPFVATDNVHATTKFYVDTRIANVPRDRVTNANSALYALANGFTISPNASTNAITILSDGTNVTTSVSGVANFSGQVNIANLTQITGFSLRTKDSSDGLFTDFNPVTRVAEFQTADGTLKTTATPGTLVANIGTSTSNIQGGVITATYANGDAVIPSVAAQLTTKLYVDSLLANTDLIANGTTNLAVNSNSVVVSANGQANVFSVTSDGTVAQSTFSNNVTILGNLTVAGNAIYTNISTFAVSDPTLQIGTGANYSPLTTDDGYDRGIIMHTYGNGFTRLTSTQSGKGNSVIQMASTAGIVAGMEIGYPAAAGHIAPGTTVVSVNGGNIVISSPLLENIPQNSTVAIGNDTHRAFAWDQSNAEFTFGSNVVPSNVITWNTLANIRSGNAQLGNLATANFFTGTLTTNAQPNITSVGNLTGLTSNGVVNFSNASNVAITLANLKIPGGSANNAIVTDNTGNLVWGYPRGIVGNTLPSTGIPIAFWLNERLILWSDTTNSSQSLDFFTSNGNVTLQFAAKNQSIKANIATGDLFISSNSSGNLNLLNTTANVGLIINSTTANLTDGANSNVRVSSTGVQLSANNNIYTINNSGSLVFPSGGNISNTGAVNANTLAVTGVSNLGAVGNVRITGGSNGSYVVTNGSGNLSFLAPKRYSKEWHVDPANGVDDALAGSYDRPFLTVNYAQTLIGGTGEVLYLHSGTYPEAVTWNDLNVDIVGVSGAGSSLVNLTGAWDFQSASSSTRCWGLNFSNVTHSGGGSLYMKNGSINGTYTKTSNAYAQLTEVTAQGAGMNITGAGSTVIEGGFQQLLTVNNASATVSVSGSGSLALANLAAGTLLVTDTTAFSGGATTPVITTSAGTALYIYNSRLIGTTAPGRISAAGFWSVNNSVFDRANSTLTGVNLQTQSTSDSIAVIGNLTVGAVSNLGAVGNVKITGGSNGQFIRTDGAGNLSFVTLSASGISNGNSNVNIATANGNVTIAAVGNTTMTVTGTGVNVSGTLNATGVITGNGSGLSALAGANVTGTVPLATVAGTVSTAAQPNITSLGALSALTVSGVANLGSNANVKISGGSLGQFLQTDGNGNLAWATGGTGTGNAIVNGNTSVSIPTAGNSVYFNVNGNASPTMLVSGTGVSIPGDILATGSNVNFVAVSNVALGNASTVKITGGNAGQVLSTTGGGNLAWITGPSGSSQFLSARRLTEQTIPSGTWSNVDIIMNEVVSSSGITYNATTGTITLTGGVTYRVTAQVNWNSGGSYAFGYRLVNSDTNVQVGAGGETQSMASPANNPSAPIIDVIFTPATTSNYRIRMNPGSSAQNGEKVRPDIGTFLTVQAIGGGPLITQGGWTVDTAWTLGGSTTAPTFATTNNRRLAWKVDGKMMTIYGYYRHTSATGAATGNGEYLLTLPGSYQVDTTVSGTSGVGTAFGLPVGEFNFSKTGTVGAGGSAIVYDATRLKFIFPAQTGATTTSTPGTWGSAYHDLTSGAAMDVSFQIVVPVL